MNFASKYVYEYSDSEEELFQDEELYTPMHVRAYAQPARNEEEAVLPVTATVDEPEDSGAPMADAEGGGGGGEESFSEPIPLTSSAADTSLASAPASERPPSFMQRLADRVRDVVGGSEAAQRSRVARNARVAPSDPAFAALHRGRMHAGRRVDTNVVSIKFNTLTEPSQMHTGEAVKCNNCQAMLSHFSKLTKATDDAVDGKIWTCEFCGKANIVDIYEEEIPKTNDVTYMITPAPATTASLAAEQGGAVDKSIIVFCVDVSGSMSVTTEVPGRFKLRGRPESGTPRIAMGDSHDQRLPNERRNITYVSRLQAMQAAVDDQLTTMKEKFPDRRAALIAFNNEVRIIGTTDHDEVVITGDKLNNKETLLQLGSGAEKPGALKDVASALCDKLFQLEEDGGTALGPALLVSVALASQEPGSKVIVCTDGLANVGVGNLEDISPERPDDMKKAQEFYDQCSELATEKGVSVSVVTIEGNRCRTLELGSVADATGGAIDTVDPLHLTERFGSILANSIIATNVTAKLLLHNKLYVRFDDRPDDRSLSFVEQHVGNVTGQTEVTFEFGIKKDKTKRKKKKTDKKSEKPKEEERPDTIVEKSMEASTTVPTEASAAKPTDAEEGKSNDGEQAGAATESAATASSAAAADEPSGPAAGAKAPPPPPPLMVDGNENLPFQLIINYTSREGAQSVRVLTKSQLVTKNRKTAEQDVSYEVMGANTAQRSARQVMEGEYTSARSSNLCQQRFLYRHSAESEQSRERYRRYVTNLTPMDNNVLHAQSREVETTGRTYSDCEGDDDFLEAELDEVSPAALAIASSAAGAAAANSNGSDDEEGTATGETAVKSAPLKGRRKKKLKRKAECEDESALAAYKMKNVSSDMF